MSGMFLIRPAAPPLAPLLASLHAQSFGVEGWSADQMRGSLALTTTRAWIAYEGDRAAGFILCQAVPEHIEILTVCVCPERRRNKIGEMLLRHVIDHARAFGAGKILLEVAADNRAARGLYEQIGFAADGVRANYYKRGAVTVDAVMYGYVV